MENADLLPAPFPAVASAPAASWLAAPSQPANHMAAWKVKVDVRAELKNHAGLLTSLLPPDALPE